MLRFLILLSSLLAISSWARVSRNEETCLLLWGPSGFGKSSFVNQFSEGKTKAPVGHRIISETATLRSYKVRKDSSTYSIVDVPGLNDAQERQGNDQLRFYIAEEMNQNHFKEIKGILLFESLAESRTSLSHTIKELKLMMGDEALRSTIVVFTKEDLVRNHLATRKRDLEKLCNNFGLPFVYWKNDDHGVIDEVRNEKQTKELLMKLNRVSSYFTDRLEKVRREIYNEALQFLQESWKNKENIVILTRNETALYVKETIYRPSNYLAKMAWGGALLALRGLISITGPIGATATFIGSSLLSWGGYDMYFHEDTVVIEGWTTKAQLEPFLLQAQARRGSRYGRDNAVNFDL